jgi:hypothetical protein
MGPVHALLGIVLVGYALSLIVRGPDGASPTWLDGWGVAAFELLASVLVLGRAWASGIASTRCGSGWAAAPGHWATSR